MSILSRLFGSKPQASVAGLGLPCPAQTTYVVGDIHGRADLLETLLVQIDEDSEQYPDAVCICLGDYVDRGENSAATLKTLQDLQTQMPKTLFCLMGNHERMMLDFVDHPEKRGGRWLRNGGLQTLASYGVSGITETTSEERSIAARDQFLDEIDPVMLDWVRKLPLQWDSGNLIVVHAALDPNLAPDAQDDRVRIWGHRDFTNLPRQDGRWVAHGHTVTETPFFGASRIAVDTGAYYSGVLTAAKVSPTGAVEFLHT